MIKKVTVVGAGIMGHGIAQLFAQKGCSVMLYDINDNILNSAIEKIKSNLRLYIDMGLQKETVIDYVISHITPTTNLRNAVAEAQFVTEAVPENLKLKIEIFREIDAISNDSVIMTSNTSTFSITEISKSIKKRDRLLMTHWFNPPYMIPVVEVVKGDSTSEETFSLTFEFLKEMGKEPVHVMKQIPGLLVNRIQTAMFREIVSLLEAGIATPENIDKAVRGSFGVRLAAIGPLATVDFAGVDLWYTGAKNLYPLLDVSREPQKLLMTMVEKGFYGIKTNKGFFEYKDEQKENIIRERDIRLLRLLHILYEETNK